MGCRVMDDEEKDTISKNPGRRFNPVVLIKKKFKLLLIITAFVLAIGGTAFLARSKPELLGIPASQQVVNSQEEIESLVQEVSKIIVLPEGEAPTVATVTEFDKVKEQKFFEKAQNGDKVLVYANAKKAYLYRPSEKRIIEVGVVNIPEPTAIVTPSVTNAVISPTPTLTSVPTKLPTQSFSQTPTIIP